MQTAVLSYQGVTIHRYDGVIREGGLRDGNGWLINAEQPLEEIFSDIALRKNDLSDMQAVSYKIAQAMLDYAALASRVLK